MDRPNSGITWLGNEKVQRACRQIATIGSVTHANFDRIDGGAKTLNYLRGLLVEHGALPARDEYGARFRTWSAVAIDRVSDQRHQEALRRFLKWHVARKFNRSDEVSEGAFLRAKQVTTVSVNFLNWLSERGTALDRLTQHDVDAWRSEGPTTREFANTFIAFAVRSRLAPGQLTLSSHQRDGAVVMGDVQQRRALAATVGRDDLMVRDKFVAVLVIVLAQQMSRVVRMTVKDLIVEPEHVIVRLGGEPINLPPPLDEIARQHAQARLGRTAAHPSTDWLFPGHRPGAHITATAMRDRIRRLFAVRAARLGSVQELAKDSPAPIVADALGYSTATIERHAWKAGAKYLNYVAARS